MKLKLNNEKPGNLSGFSFETNSVRIGYQIKENL